MYSWLPYSTEFCDLDLSIVFHDKYQWEIWKNRFPCLAIQWLLDSRGQFHKDAKSKKLLLALHLCLQGDQPASFVKSYVGSPPLAFWWTLPCPLTNFDRFSIGTCWRESIHKRGKKNLDIITNINNTDTDAITNINISGCWRKSILKREEVQP